MAKARRITAKPYYLVSQMNADGNFEGVRGVYSTPKNAFDALFAVGVREDYDNFVDDLEYEDIYESPVLYGRRFYYVEPIHLDFWLM